MYRKLNNNELNRVSIPEFREMEKMPLVVVLDNVRSQHNIGAAFRTADAFAARSLVLCGISATPPSPEIRKSALGAEESVPWEYFKETTQAVQQLKEKGYTVLAMEQTVNSVELQKFQPAAGSRYAIVFGNEVKGVSQDVINLCDGTLEIPQFGTKHSLNVSVSVGIALWDFTFKYNQLNDHGR